MNLLKRFYYGGVNLVPFKLLTLASPVKSLFPYHHIVSDEDVPHIKNLYPYKNVKQFSDDLEYLLKKFSPIDLRELNAYIDQHNQLPAGKFLLSFDDGFREAKEVIAPILKARGVPAIFFINPAFIDNKEMFYRNKISLLVDALKKKKNESLVKQCSQILGNSTTGSGDLFDAMRKINYLNKELVDQLAVVLDTDFSEYLKNRKPWLTTEELASLAADGFAIGAHSWDHPYYNLISLGEQLEQTLSSCDFVRTISPGNISFSFPHSDAGVSQDFFKRLHESDRRPALLFGTQNQKNELKNRIIHRFNAERPDLNMRKSAKGIMTYSLLQTMISKQNIQRSYA
jgi:peptidoglycan/xylan/chitin deacetylase (PgdA/CDA1 family)